MGTSPVDLDRWEVFIPRHLFAKKLRCVIPLSFLRWWRWVLDWPFLVAKKTKSPNSFCCIIRPRFLLSTAFRILGFGFFLAEVLKWRGPMKKICPWTGISAKWAVLCCFGPFLTPQNRIFFSLVGSHALIFEATHRAPRLRPGFGIRWAEF